jgi:uncharacterized damage-inducible protein DinB
MSNREFFIERLEAEYPATRRVLRALPPGKLDWRPHAKSRSARELVALLAYELQTGIELCRTGQLNWDESAIKGGPLEEMISSFERHHKTLVEHLRRLDDATWSRKTQFLVRGMPVLEDTVAGLFWLALFDAVHHRGQLSVYIRPMGGKVPSIYGPSADEQAG